MTISVHDSLSGKTVPFEPLNAPQVRLYVCGLTPYDHVHIGHARTYVAFDVIRRWLEYRGYRVKHVQNVTDVDDKIIARAAEVGEQPGELAARFDEEGRQAMRRLGIQDPHVMPKVSEHVQEIRELIAKLVERGAAYEAQGNVYFAVKSFPDYGRLSKVNVEEMLEGVRKEVAEGKRDALDFALWKKAKPGEPFWGSPWGPGRPGWHIECSAMAIEHLGRGMDIHGGGMDLKFPHHENEIAQSEAATGVRFVKHWMHTGFLTVNGEKMSKSLGNFITLTDALSKWRPEALRLFFVGTHYRSRIDFSEASVAQAGANVEYVWNTLASLEHAVRVAAAAEGTSRNPAGESMRQALADRRAAFETAMDDDLNTPVALAELLALCNAANRYLKEEAKPNAALVQETTATLRQLAGILGILPQAGGADDLAPRLVELLLELRSEARKRKDFATSDRIRDGLKAAGVVVEDTPTGAKWRRA
ncbi:MAG TPA: cysteine--tRNA ligase [Candidatus Thermoplasmatota archaeon]|nr:cysteine--tRNA ligase [Candidatus Thermoplasmatota archaeon]